MCAAKMTELKRIVNRRLWQRRKKWQQLMQLQVLQAITIVGAAARPSLQQKYSNKRMQNDSKSDNKSETGLRELAMKIIPSAGAILRGLKMQNKVHP